MKNFLLIGVILILTGCSAIELTPEAQKVIITHVEPGKDCEFLGTITGSQGNAFTGFFTANSTMETGALNDLRNQAAKMGGNLVVMLTQRAGQSTNNYGQSAQTNVTTTGNVYRCK